MATEVTTGPDSSWTLDGLPFGHPATDRVPIVVSRKDDDLHVTGTAVLVVPGLVLTARLPAHEDAPCSAGDVVDFVAAELASERRRPLP